MNKLLEDLQARGLIYQSSDLNELSDLLDKKKITLYCGYDPTADSLHIGHLTLVLMLRRFQNHGHRPIALVGGATGLIGDPSFKATERTLNPAEKVGEWVEKIKEQLKPFLSFEGENACIMANNYDWLGKMDLLTFLRDVGKNFSVNAMINRDAVKQRLQREDQGISFTEFSYNLLQSYDFAELARLYDCELQVGGSDQWGNITSGIDLARRLHKKQLHALTAPLVTKADGTKFGKTESGAVWLSPEKTSPYQFYQFWLKTQDADVYKFLKYFTFLEVAEIDRIEAEDKASGEKPKAQEILAKEMTRLVHGEKALEAAMRITSSLFKDALDELTEEDFKQLELDGLPAFRMKENPTIVEALVQSELAKSNNESRGFIQQGAVSINGKKVESNDLVIGRDGLFYGKYAVLKRGKRNHALLVFA